MAETEQLELDHYAGPTPELKERLQRLAHEMLLAAKDHGVGFDEVRHAAETRGWLTGLESGRFLSFGSPLMKAAGGQPVSYRRSRHAKSQRRRVAVYVHKSFLPVLDDA